MEINSSNLYNKDILKTSKNEIFIFTLHFTFDPPNKYYWSVPPINKSFIGGPFSAINSFNIATTNTVNSDSNIQVFPNRLDHLFMLIISKLKPT